MRIAVVALLLLLLPGLLLPGVLPLCLCAENELDCCGAATSPCCCDSANNDASQSGPKITNQRECAGCVSVTLSDSELRLAAPEHAVASLPAPMVQRDPLPQLLPLHAMSVACAPRRVPQTGPPNAPLSLRI
ncbi:MAG: hypothetical protein EXS14_08460 [Planctomycetes bacterium]|nr:hypothetical protein [Planctomycetota bacterium]